MAGRRLGKFSLLRDPDHVVVQDEGEMVSAVKARDGWRSGDVRVLVSEDDGRLRVTVSATKTLICHVMLRWEARIPAGARILGDHWERGYGDLEWRGIVSERVMPWYFLLFAEGETYGAGVRTGAGAMCYWTVDPRGVSLRLDLRCGGQGVELKGRRLDAAVVVERAGEPGETAHAAARGLCRMLCPRPLMPAAPVYGGNDWYFCYGRNSERLILEHAQLVADLAPRGARNRPFMVVDMGWGRNGGIGPWREGHAGFPDMAGLARKMRGMGVRPGIWIRPLRSVEALPAGAYLPAGRYEDRRYSGAVLDASRDDVLEHVAEDVGRLKAWGYELIKHDYTTRDLLGRWGFEMGSQLTPDGWSFGDRSRTTAEIITGLYRAIRRGAGDAVVIGCNTVGHLAAGMVELQRTGDDTSGIDWERTRRMGVNTMAFRSPQHGAFFSADADCVAVTRKTPWPMNRQWLDLVARSGTPLFVSVEADACGAAQRRALAGAFANAAVERPPAEPLDWMDNTCPARWRIDGEEVEYDWWSGGASVMKDGGG